MAVEVELRPVDLDGVPIRVSIGKTTIGRGPFLRCSDKKVSRNHAVLDLSEDGVFTITSTHVNPSYYVKEGREKSEILLPDKPQKLENGDQISLLANAYVYEVVIKELASDSGVDSNDAHKTSVKEETKSTTSTDEEEEEEDEEEETKDKPVGKNPDKKDKNPSALAVSKKEDDEKTPAEVSDVKDEIKTEIGDVEQSQSEDNDASTETRKRTLPDWLIHSASASLTKAEPAPPVTQRRPGRPRKNKEASATPPPPATHAKASTSTNDSPQARSTRAKKQISYYAVDDNDSDDDEFTTPKRKRSVGRSRDNDPDYSSNALRKNSGDDSEKESPKRKRKASGGGSPTKRNRHNCEYGAKCYRKNPTHFKEFSHPGDSDYSSDKGEDANDEQDEKPECEYGVDCFRKNPKHRREFKHTKKSRPKREAAKLARYADGDSDVDEGDEDFLDDESDEYNPEESDDDTDEDVGRLAKEAKSFVRNKKMYKMPK